jgi:hypothetical protein
VIVRSLSTRWLVWAVLSCVLAAPAPCLAAPDVDAILESVVRAYGGTSAVARLESFRVDGMLQAHTRGLKAQVRRDIASPEKLRVTIIYPQRTEVRILDGDRGWRGSGFHQEEVRSIAHLAMVYQFIRSTVPRSMLGQREKLEPRGERTEQGRTYVVLHLPRSPGLAIDFWIDESTRHVARVEGTLSRAHMEMSLATHFSDFRKVDGLLFPHAEENFAGGHHAGTTEITDVSFAPDDLGPFTPFSPGGDLD